MSFLRKEDYSSLIELDRLDVVTGVDNNLITQCELSTQAEIESYISNYYDVSKIFIDILSFRISTAYLIGDLILWSESAYLPATTYSVGDRCSYLGNIYKCNTAATTGVWNASKWTLLTTNESWWNVTANVTGHLPYDSTDTVSSESFAAGDTRNAKIKQLYIDMVLYDLHSRISPRNIPELRVKRYDDAVSWLKMIQKGKIQANLPIIDAITGTNISYGSNLKTNNIY